MPVRAISITTTIPAYTASCDDCKDWYATFKLKRNADTSMLAHRIIKHSYVRKESYGKPDLQIHSA